jgi:hypothetical protein
MLEREKLEKIRNIDDISMKLENAEKDIDVLYNKFFNIKKIRVYKYQ